VEKRRWDGSWALGFGRRLRRRVEGMVVAEEEAPDLSGEVRAGRRAVVEGTGDADGELGGGGHENHLH
jgi:hypothetical protein